MRLIAVVMGSPSSKIRNAEVSRLLDYGYNTYEVDRVLSKESIIETIEVEKGNFKMVQVNPVRDVNILNKKGEQKKIVTYKLDITKIKVPIKIGDIIGKLNVIENKEIIMEVDVTVSKNVKKENLFRLYFRYLNDIFSGNVKI